MSTTNQNLEAGILSILSAISTAWSAAKQQAAVVNQPHGALRAHTEPKYNTGSDTTCQSILRTPRHRQDVQVKQLRAQANEATVIAMDTNESADEVLRQIRKHER